MPAKTDRRILASYTDENGQLVTVYKPHKPRQGEKTWRSGAKYSIANLGGKARTLRNEGLSHAKG